MSEQPGNVARRVRRMGSAMKGRLRKVEARSQSIAKLYIGEGHV